MGSYKSIHARIMKTPTVKDITPAELQRFLEHNGFVLKRSKGSHFIYGYPEYPNLIVIPMHNPIKPAYIDMVREIIINKGEEDHE